jgi:hypothetical protein
MSQKRAAFSMPCAARRSSAPISKSTGRPRIVVRSACDALSAGHEYHQQLFDPVPGRRFHFGPFSCTAGARWRAELLDLVSADENAFQIQAHYLVRIWPEGGTLRWSFLDSDWMKKQAGSLLPTRKLNDRLVISASPDAAHALMLKYGADERALRDVETLTRDE